MRPRHADMMAASAMAGWAERRAVTRLVSQPWEVCPRLDVVRVHALLGGIPTLLAHEPISALHLQRPCHVLAWIPLPRVSALPRPVGCAESLHRLTASSIANRLAMFWRQLLAGERGGYSGAGFRLPLHAAMKIPGMGRVLQRQGLSLFRIRHASARFVGSLHATSSVRALFDLSARAHVAGQSVFGRNAPFYNEWGAQ